MHDIKKAKILLVDDIPANIIALTAVLESPRYELVEAHSGKTAIDLCTKEDFALIVLDVSMPVLDGYETARQIKRGERNRDVPIIFVTATYKEDPAVRKGFEVGAVDYFGKPFDPEVLNAKVRIYTDLYLKTKRLEETEELLKTHAQIKTLIEAIPIGVIITDSSGRIFESNEEVRRIWGDLPADGAPMVEYKGWYPDGTPIAPDEWPVSRALNAGETTRELRILVESAEGKRRSFVHSAYPIRAKKGQILGAVGIFQDVSASQEFADKLESRTLQLLRDIRDLGIGGK